MIHMSCVIIAGTVYFINNGVKTKACWYGDKFTKGASDNEPHSSAVFYTIVEGF